MLIGVAGLPVQNTSDSIIVHSSEAVASIVIRDPGMPVVPPLNVNALKFDDRADAKKATVLLLSVSKVFT